LETDATEARGLTMSRGLQPWLQLAGPCFASSLAS